jgi:hypothetical protein
MRPAKFVLCAAIAAAGLAAAVVASPPRAGFAPEVRAGDPPKDKPKKDPAQVKREKNLADLAGYFGSKNTSLLINRVPADAKLAISLAGKEADYSATQARGVLDTWFDEVQTCSVDVVGTKEKPVKYDDKVGVFPITVQRKGGKEKGKEGTLTVTLGDLGADGFYTLKKLAVAVNEK